MADRWNTKKVAENEDWLMSYADMITLLMTFFILIISMSTIDMVKFEQVEKGVAKDISKHAANTPIAQLKTEMNELIKGMKLDETDVNIGQDDRGVVLEFDANTFFDVGTAKLNEKFLPPLAKMADLLNSPRYSAFQVEIQGHTDDTPVSTPVFPSNWELSGGRAAAVVRFFIRQGMTATRLAAEGFADTHPKVSNRDVNGNPLRENQAINRRVSVHIFPR
jgi:chemotaxis protein MotB